MHPFGIVKVDKMAIGVCSKNRKCTYTDAKNLKLGSKNKEPFLLVEGVREGVGVRDSSLGSRFERGHARKEVSSLLKSTRD